MKFLVTGGAGFIGSNFMHYEVKKYPEDTFVCLDALTYAGNYNNIKDLESFDNFKFIKGDITDNEKYIKAVNTVTNVVYNIILLYFTTAVHNLVALVIYILLSELIIIPLVETFAYKKMSSKPLGTILKCSYKANLLSALAGVLIEAGFFFILSILPI